MSWHEIGLATLDKSAKWRLVLNFASIIRCIEVVHTGAQVLSGQGDLLLKLLHHVSKLSAIYHTRSTGVYCVEAADDIRLCLQALEFLLTKNE